MGITNFRYLLYEMVEENAAAQQEAMNPMAQAVGEVLLQRVKSVVPCSCTNAEATVLPAKISDVWAKIRYWKLEDIAPTVVGATELSERNHTLAYELVAAEPATSVSSIV